MSLRPRQPFPRAAAHAALLRLLLAFDGSTTRLCEALAARPVELFLHRQLQTQDVPLAVRDRLGGDAWLARVTSLACDGVVMMDNLSYTRLDAAPEWFLSDLRDGKLAVGHLLDRLFVKREFMDAPMELKAGLWEVVGAPDDNASRAYRIVTPDGPLMLIFEAFRAGMVPAADR